MKKELNEGDIVEIRKTNTYWDGHKGIVQKVEGFEVVVRIFANDICFDLSEVHRVNNIRRIINGNGKV